MLELIYLHYFRCSFYNFLKIGTDKRYNKVNKSKMFQSNAEIFDGDMTLSNFDVMSDN